MAQQKSVQEQAVELGIPYLVHFTRTDHLPSIMKYGVYPVSRFDEIGIAPTVNDIHRFDGRPNAVSLSIAHPNSSMLYKCRMENPTVSWSILVIKHSLLWEKPCAFCRHNAADNRIRLQEIEQLNTSASLKGMYDDGDGITLPTRTAQSLKNHDPTDIQAEVLLFEIVPPEYIYAVVFDSVESKNSHLECIGNRKPVVHHNNGLFSQRTYVRNRDVRNRGG